MLMQFIKNIRSNNNKKEDDVSGIQYKKIRKKREVTVNYKKGYF